MTDKKTQLREAIRRMVKSVLAEGFEIPRRVTEMSEDIKVACAEQGALRVNATPFNSGYVGVSIEIPKVGKFIYVDQPGMMSPEDQTAGYIALVPGGQAITKSNAIVWVDHPKGRHGGGWGEIQITGKDYEAAKERVLSALQEVIEDAGIY